MCIIFRGQLLYGLSRHRNFGTKQEDIYEILHVGKQFTISRMVVDPEDIGGISIRKIKMVWKKVMNETTS